jgi:hypothetical protein
VTWTQALAERLARRLDALAERVRPDSDADRVSATTLRLLAAARYQARPPESGALLLAGVGPGDDPTVEALEVDPVPLHRLDAVLGGLSLDAADAVLVAQAVETEGGGTVAVVTAARDREGRSTFVLHIDSHDKPGPGHATEVRIRTDGRDAWRLEQISEPAPIPLEALGVIRAEELISSEATCPIAT